MQVVSTLSGTTQQMKTGEFLLSSFILLLLPLDPVNSLPLLSLNLPISKPLLCGKGQPQYCPEQENTLLLGLSLQAQVNFSKPCHGV